MSAVTRRVSWSFLDQVLSSGSNFALTAFVAASVSTTSFGAFTLVYAVYGVCVGLSAGLTSIPLVVRYSAADPGHFRRASRRSVGTALVAGVVGAAACLAAAPLTDSAIADPLRALGMMLPGLLTQDAWRYSFVTGGRPAKAAAIDGAWIVLQMGAIGVLLAAGSVSALSMVLAWGGSATAAAGLGCLLAGTTPAPREALTWLRAQRDLTFRYAAEALIHRSGWWLTFALVGAVAGLRVVGAVRGAILLLGGPLNLLFIGATFAFVSEGVRLVNHSPARLAGAMRSLSAVTALIAALWCTLVLCLPNAVGARVLGATWIQARPLLPLLVIFMLALAATMGPTQGMLALGAARRSLFTQLSTFCVDVPVITTGAVLAGARGAVIATCLTALFRTGLAWVQFRRALREQVDSVRAPDEAPALAAAGH